MCLCMQYKCCVCTYVFHEWRLFILRIALSIACILQAPQLTANMTEVTQYVLEVRVNGSLQVIFSYVPAGTTIIDLFSSLANDTVRERYTTYSVKVAAINSGGQGVFTEPETIGKMPLLLVRKHRYCWILLIIQNAPCLYLLHAV